MRVLILLAVVAGCIAQDLQPVADLQPVVSSQPDVDPRVYEEEEDLDVGSLFTAMFSGEVTANTREGKEMEGSDPNAETPIEPQEKTTEITDEETISKYNRFVDLFLQRVNGNMRTGSQPMKVNLSKKASQRRAQRRKAANNKKRQGRHPKDLNLDEVLTEQEEDGREERDIDVELTIIDDDEEDLLGDEKYEDELLEDDVNARESKDLDLGDETEMDEETTEDEALEQEKDWNTEDEALEQDEDFEGRMNNKRKKAAAAKRKRINQAKRRKNQNKKKGNRKGSPAAVANRRKAAAAKRKAAAAAKRKAAAAAKRRAANRRKGTVAANMKKINRRKAAAKRRNKGKQGARIMAEVRGYTNLARNGDVRVVQVGDKQEIDFDFTMGPVAVDVSKHLRGTTMKASASSNSVSGVINLTVMNNGVANIQKVQIKKPKNVQVNGNLRQGNNPKSVNTNKKLVRNSVKRVNPIIQNMIFSAAKEILDSTNSAIQNN